MTKKRTGSPVKPVGDREDVRFAQALQRAMARQREALLRKRGSISAEAAKSQKPAHARCST